MIVMNWMRLWDDIRLSDDVRFMFYDATIYLLFIYIINDFSYNRMVFF